MINYSESDINRQLAHNAHANTSFSPERRADGIIREYLANMEEVSQEFAQFATDENREALAAALEKYRVGYLARLNAYLHSHSRVASAFVCGPANFPVARNEKRSRWADNKRDAWLEWRKSYLTRLRRQYDPRCLANAPIKAGDEDAIDKLRAKIEQHEKYQKQMKQANKVVRQKGLTDEQKVSAVADIMDISEATAWKLLAPDFAGRLGFPDYALTNNSANIRRLKERLAQVERHQARPQVADKELPGGVRIVENKELDRLQTIFPGKPDADIRGKLKARGFKWAPSQNAWQRQLTDNAREAARQALGL